MSRYLWLRAFRQRWFGRGFQRSPSTRSRVSPRGEIRPSLEVLEDRTVPAVFNIAAGDTQGLINAMQTANNNGDLLNVINLTDSTYNLQTVNNNLYGPNGLPIVANNLIIHGNGATIQRLSGGGFNTPDFRLFYVSGGMPGTGLEANLTIEDATLQGGIAQGGDSNEGGGGLGAGGAIFNQGTLNLIDVTLTNNRALGGNSSVSTAGNGGGGMGTSSPAANNDGGGFGGVFNPHSGGGTGNLGGGGGGDGFLLAASAGLNATDTAPGNGGGLGGFGGAGFGASAFGDGGSGGHGGGSSSASASGDGGAFGKGGLASFIGGGDTSGGGGGGVGGGGGEGDDGGGSGGFGGGGAFGFGSGGMGGFGGGSGGKGLIGGTDTNGGAFGGASSGGLGGGGAGLGGAIFNMGADSAHPGSGQATLVNCTFNGNIAQGGSAASQGNGGTGAGGAIFNLDGNVTLTNDTLLGNGALKAVSGLSFSEGGGIFQVAFGNDIATGQTVTAKLVLNNSIVALNTGDSGADLRSQVFNGRGTNTATVSGSHNLITDGGAPFPGLVVSTANPLLGPLQNNGGLTPTLLPQPGSPVLGAGDPGLAPPTDQRGVPRPPKGPTDLGSVQVSVAPSPPAGTPPSSPPASPPAPPAPSLFQAILSVYIAEVEKDIGFGNPSTLQDTINFNAQYTVIFGINIAPLIEGLADSNVAAARSGNS